MVKKKPAMKGGFFLTDKFTDFAISTLGGRIPNRADQRYVDLFYTTLNTATSAFNLLSDSSLYGFLFRQDVNPSSEPAEEYVFNNPGCHMPRANAPRFVKSCFRPLGSYIHKVVFVGPPNTQYAYDGNPRGKALEDRNGFAREAAIQFDIWNNFNGGITMVPPILTPTPAFVPIEGFMGHPLVSRCMQNANFAAAAQAARGVGATGACIITMGMATGYVTLDSIYRRGNPAATHRAATLGRMAHIVLLSTHRLIHGDAHMQNIMISETETNWVAPEFVGRALLIDFGQAVEISTDDYARIVKPIADSAAKPRPWHTLLPLIRAHVRQHAEWFDAPLFPGENINPDVDNGLDAMSALWQGQKESLATIPAFAALGRRPTSQDAERVIKRLKGPLSLFGPNEPAPVAVGRGRTHRKGRRRTRTRKNR